MKTVTQRWWRVAVVLCLCIWFCIYLSSLLIVFIFTQRLNLCHATWGHIFSTPPSVSWSLAAPSLLSSGHGSLTAAALSEGSYKREVCLHYQHLVVFVGILTWVDISCRWAKYFHLKSQLVFLAKWFRASAPLVVFNNRRISNINISAVLTCNCCPLMTREKRENNIFYICCKWCIYLHLATSIRAHGCQCTFFLHLNKTLAWLCTSLQDTTKRITVHCDLMMIILPIYLFMLHLSIRLCFNSSETPNGPSSR